MRKSSRILAAAVVLSASTLMASPLLEETFEGYTNGQSLQGFAGGLGWTGGWDVGAAPQFNYLNQIRNGSAANLAYPNYTAATTPAASGSQFLNLAGGFGGPDFNYAERFVNTDVGGTFDSAGLVANNDLGNRAVGADNTTLWGSFLVQAANNGTELWLRNPGINDNKFNFGGSTPGGSTSLVLYRIDYKEGPDSITFWNNVNIPLWTPDSPRFITRNGEFSLNKFIWIQSFGGDESRLDDIRFGTANTDVVPLPGASAARTWIAGGSGDYLAPGNWSGGVVPNATNATANFSAASGGNTANITSASPVVLGTLRLTSADNQRITAPTVSLASNLSDTLVEVSGGQHEVNASVAFLQTGSIAIDSGSSLRLASLNNQFPNVTITKTGPGLLTTGEGFIQGSFVNSQGTSTFDSVSGTGSLVATAGVLAATRVTNNRIQVSSGATFQLVPGKKTSVPGTVTLDGGASFDVTDNTVIFRNGDLTALRASVAGWLAGGAGYSTSLASPTSNMTVAVFSNDSGDGVTPYYGSYGSANFLETNTVIVRGTYIGDTNIDGIVDGIDLINVLEGYSNGYTGWQNGDVDYVNGVTALDVAAVLNAIGLSQPSLGFPTGGGTRGTVPEPSSLALVALVGAPLVRRRR